MSPRAYLHAPGPWSGKKEFRLHSDLCPYDNSWHVLSTFLCASHCSKHFKPLTHLFLTVAFELLRGYNYCLHFTDMWIQTQSGKGIWLNSQMEKGKVLTGTWSQGLCLRLSMDGGWWPCCELRLEPSTLISIQLSANPCAVVQSGMSIELLLCSGVTEKEYRCFVLEVLSV